ncbi:MAG TPA: DUF2332 domain-containing protein [Acidimicrobiales bacterium]|nr:DUF2332 domain-containing protein [Acidimicrobiales bacterium]
MIDAHRRQSLARAFVGFLPLEDRARHPTYWAICRGVAEDPFLLELADVVPAPQLPVNVFLAAVHHLLLEGADHELATHYRSVCERRGLAFRPTTDLGITASFASFCGEFRGEIAERCAVRATQTNEVGRCAVLRATLASLHPNGAVGLLDAGCSAGLNLLVDAYGCDYDGVLAGPTGAAPVLRCALVGAPPPLELPQVAARVGLDLSPVDVTDHDAVAWLLACLWPDDLERFERLEQAVSLAAARRSELELRRGDMVDDLASAARATDAPHLVIVNSWSASYLEVERRHEFAAAVAAVAATRATSWIAMEFPSVARDLGVLRPDAVLAHRASVVCVTDFDRTVAASRVVAEAHPHGRWLHWRSA